MDACSAVEKEIDKVLSKFDDIHRHSESNIDELLNHVQNIKKDIEAGEQSS
mgnify:CR=1 FL=1